MDSRYIAQPIDYAGVVPELIPNSGFAPLSHQPVWILRRALLERKVMASFAAYMYALGDLKHASLRTRFQVLDAVRAVVPAIDVSACTSSGDRYGRRVLWEDPAGWSLAAISLNDGQETEAHDHAGWGGAVTVQGIERNRRFTLNGSGELVLLSQRDYLAGTGYLFDASEVHQPIGVDPRRLTVALHLLVHDHDAEQHRHEGRHGGEERRAGGAVGFASMFIREFQGMHSTSPVERPPDARVVTARCSTSNRWNKDVHE